MLGVGSGFRVAITLDVFFLPLATYRERWRYVRKADARRVNTAAAAKIWDMKHVCNAP